MSKISISVVAVALLAGSAFADGTGIITQNAFSYGSGGQFTITPTSGYLGETGLPGDLSNNTFESFCMELNEEFNPGLDYIMNINVEAVHGGIGGGGISYPLDPRTAFLYWNFRMGTLPGYDYANVGVGRANSAGDLQNAIWWFQGNQIADPNNAFEALANLVVGAGAWQGIGDVRVLNVYYHDGSLSQDQLTIVPTPGAASLAGLGILAAARRRRV